jgi:hypothetical protein
MITLPVPPPMNVTISDTGVAPVVASLGKLCIVVPLFTV